MSFSLSRRLLAIVAIAVATVVAHADNVHIVITPVGGGHSVSFSFDTKDATVNPGLVEYYQGAISVPLKPAPGTGSTYFGTIAFATSTSGYPFTFGYEDIEGFLLNFSGSQVFSGTENAPIFTAGDSFVLQGANFGAPDITLTIAPEPSSIALLGTGALSLVGTFRRRLFLS